MQELNFDENIYNTIRRNIKKYRKLKGITAAQLAEAVNLSHDFIRQIESEKVGYNFSVETLYKISVALEVGLDKLTEKADELSDVSKETLDENRIEPVRIVQWEVDNGLAKSNVLLDSVIYCGEVASEQIQKLYKVKLEEFVMQRRVRNYAEIYSDKDAISKLNFSVYDPRQYLTVVVERIKSLFENKNVEFEVDCKIENDGVILDSRRTKLALYNIISNSIIHSGRSNVRVKVSAVLRGDDLVIAITDNGRCIKESEASDLFEVVGLKNLAKPKDLSLVKGLGLAVSRKLAREMNGDVVYIPSSRYNRFEFTISQLERRKCIREESADIEGFEELEMYMAEALLSRME